MKKFITNGLILVAMMAFLGQSCTNLDEELHSQILAEDFFQTEEEFTSALGVAYTAFYGYMGDYLASQEVSSDAVVTPTRGKDWDDGGHWRRLHTHNFKPDDPIINGTWNFGFGGVNTCNRLIEQFEASGNEKALGFVAELKVVRAMFYTFLLDSYGNVPIVTQFNVPDGFAPETKSRAEVYNFILDEINANIGTLSKDIAANYGRMHYYAAQALLAKLYLNAGVYTGTPEWQKAADACNEIINSNLYSLPVDYFANFKTSNQESSEFIFAIPYDQVFAQGNNLAQRTLHYLQQEEFGLTEQPWNGYSAMAEFYNSFTDPALNPGPAADDLGEEIIGGNGDPVAGKTFDTRVRSFLAGKRYSRTTGEQLQDADASAADPDGPGLKLMPELNELGPNALRQAGARIGKWEYAAGSNRDLSNDVAIYRYGDVLLMKAEALWQMDNGSSEALTLVNEIRARAGVDPFDALTAERLLAERGREMCFEGHRRTDLIRFGAFNDEWWAKTATPNATNNNEAARLDADVQLFPIPQGQLDANGNLSQNPGY